MSMNIVSNCPLCEAHSLHVVGQGQNQTQQCINCGYATSFKFKGDKKNNEIYNSLPEDMKNWSKESNDMIWIPSMITLPFGTLYPENIDGKMKWAFAEMVDIPEKEQEKYPKEDGTGNHTKRYDTDNAIIYDVFLEAITEMNKRAKKDGPSEIQSL
tara:strand:+ start:82 stop:549 length:468 start_codon:yes stop_codon:yes gene_type:complete